MSDRQAKNIVSDNSEKKWLLSHELKTILDCAPTAIARLFEEF